MVKNAATAVRQSYVATQKLLGAGTFGKVFLFKDKNPKVKTKYAIKVICKDGRSPVGLGKIRQEINILSAMDHPNVIRFVESFEDDRYMYLVTEFIPRSKDVKQLVKEKVKSKRIDEPLFSEGDVKKLMYMTL